MWESNGYKRAFGIFLLLAAKVPQLAPYSAALEFLGGFFGVTGVAHAYLKAK